MQKVIVASNNPVKVEATRRGFQTMFPDCVFQFDNFLVTSDVGQQPETDEETFQGAMNRAQNAREGAPDADYWVGIEGGVDDVLGDLVAFAWIVILSRGVSGKSRTGTFILPNTVAHLVRQGIELGHADDIVFERKNSKQKDGAIGILSDGVLDRTEYYEHAVLLALVPIKKAQLYE
jgi:inosine/xanthosine triphosphatase